MSHNTVTVTIISMSALLFFFSPVQLLHVSHTFFCLTLHFVLMSNLTSGQGTVENWHIYSDVYKCALSL